MIWHSDWPMLFSGVADAFQTFSMLHIEEEFRTHREASLLTICLGFDGEFIKPTATRKTRKSPAGEQGIKLNTIQQLQTDNPPSTAAYCWSFFVSCPRLQAELWCLRYFNNSEHHLQQSQGHVGKAAITAALLIVKAVWASCQDIHDVQDP